MTGKVYLVGAGPGDVELLTLKAVRALGEADVVLLDDLVNRDVLRFVPARARVIEVGKRGGCRSTPQAFIERLMVRMAKTGATVARVKGGDPFVFGRGGEEMEALCAAGIAVEVVSGITAGLGVPATLGIPVTQRGACHGVTLVTGHTRDGREPNWTALAQSGTTLVIYMGVATLSSLVQRLVAAGMPPRTPAAAIQNGTLPEQRSIVVALSDLPRALNEAQLGSPAILVIGEVVKFARTAAQSDASALSDLHATVA
jgi:uroporphyrin-III C-methyltransferase